jgi:hypothetical protein
VRSSRAAHVLLFLRKHTSFRSWQTRHLHTACMLVLSGTYCIFSRAAHVLNVLVASCGIVCRFALRDVLVKTTNPWITPAAKSAACHVPPPSTGGVMLGANWLQFSGGTLRAHSHCC